MDISGKLCIMHELAKQQAGLGKTAMMKYLFLLQKVYDVPLNYNFEIYTYGPYSYEVMEDIDFAKNQNIISVKPMLYSGYMGYMIEAKDYTFEEDLAELYKNKISKLLRLFGEKTVKELELLSTIIYLYSNFKMNSWNFDKDTIIDDVHEIKPYFNLEDIKKEYERLEKNEILKISM